MTDVVIRPATAKDVPGIVAMLGDDETAPAPGARAPLLRPARLHRQPRGLQTPTRLSDLRRRCREGVAGLRIGCLEGRARPVPLVLAGTMVADLLRVVLVAAVLGLELPH